MALPVAPPPRPSDAAVLYWAGLTVRIAWVLLRLGVKVRPAILEEARTHVLFHLDAAAPVAAAEDLAEHLTEGFVARARGRQPDDPWPQDWAMPVSRRWVDAATRTLDPLTRAVFRKHYGDHRSLARLAERLQVPPVELQAAREGLYEALRALARTDGLDFDTWPPARLDRLLRRLAAWAPGPCPAPADVIAGRYRHHARECPRCDRMARLVQSGILDRAQLTPRSLYARPTSTSRVLALQVHPEAHACRRALADELPLTAFPIRDDVLLVDADEWARIWPALTIAAEVGSPQAAHLRGIVLEGPGQWGQHGLAGPLPERALAALEDSPWGEVSGQALPEELPVPPSAAAWWRAVAGLAVALGLLAGLMWATWEGSAEGEPEGPGVHIALTPARGGLWAAFDVPERELVTVVASTPEGLRVVLESTSAADKVAFAIGDGGYRLHVAGDGLLVAAHPAPLPDLGERLRRAMAADDPLQALARSLEPVATVASRQR